MAFQQGLSGLNATSKALEIIGNNIANANTFGAKASRAEFSDMYAAALNGAGANSIGIGVRLAAVAQQFTQGNISVTENSMDLAINGAGFFRLQDRAGQELFSRNGQFKVDRDGFIVNNQGLLLTDGIQPLQLPTRPLVPQPTSRIGIELNLDSRARPVATPVPAIDPSDPTTYNNATSMTVFDVQGEPIPLTLYFQRADPATVTPPDPVDVDRWNVLVTANGTPVTTTPRPFTMAFQNGLPLTPPPPPASPPPASPFTLSISGGPLTTPISVDLRQATQFGAAFGVTNMTQDGYALGQLAGITIGPNGTILARFTNGQSQPVEQIALATFRNPQGLQPMGNNVWTSTHTSGDPIVGVPGEGGRGLLQAGALEESNVDLTAELVRMISAQRMFQANAQTIKTMDQALQSVVNLR